MSNTPFRRHQEDTTLAQYLNTVTRLVSMLLRLPEFPSYSLPLPAPVTLAIAELQKKLEECSGQPSHPDLRLALHTLFMALWGSQWHPTPSNPIPCPTHRLLILLSLEPDGGHKEAGKTTQPIAHLKYAMRLAFLHRIQTRATASLANSHFAAYHTTQQWLHEKQPCPFDTICALQHLATALAMSTITLPQIFWTDRVHHQHLLYRGSEVDFPKFSAMFQAMESDLLDMFENQVLMGLKEAIVPLPPRIFEDLINTAEGYSFVNDPRNQTFIDARTRLWEAVAQNPSVSSQFWKIENGEIVWHKIAMRKWLIRYAEFSCLLMARCEMLGGGPGRGTELTAMSFRSTKTYRQRNLSILDRHVALLRTYTKVNALSGRDRLIPHSTDAFTASLLIQNLVLIRPWAELLVSICFPNDKAVLQLYQYKLFVNFNHLFKSDDLSHVMKQYTHLHLGTPFGLQAWRHIAIALRRYLCPSAHGFFEDLESDTDHDSAAILQTGHSRRMEDMRYAITPESMKGLSEDIIPMYLDASTEWQIVCEVVPGAYFLRSHSCRV